MLCSSCGRPFGVNGSKGTGRPRTRCEDCRSNQARADSTAWRELRARVLREEPICAMPRCGRRSTQVDHIVPLSLRPDLALVRSNLLGMCGPHNAAKGARVPRPPRPPVRRWICSCGDPKCPRYWHL